MEQIKEKLPDPSKYRSETQVFTFPAADQTQFDQVRDLAHFRQLIADSECQLNKYFYRANSLFRSRYANQLKYIDVSCTTKLCPGRLRYRKKQSNGRYQLIDGVRVHTHFQTQTTTNFAIQSFIRQHEGKLQSASLRKLVERTFGISTSQYYYQYKRLMEQMGGKGFATIVQNLILQGYLVQTVPERDKLTDNQFDIPDMIIVVSQDMKNAYEKFGQFMSFDVTYNLVKEKRVELDAQGEKKTIKWGLGLMVGKSNHNKIVPFGIVITNTQTVDAFKYMFAVFFKMMEKQPESIITDQQITIGAALKALKDQGYWDGVHLLDTFHLLRNIRFKLAQKSTGKTSNKDVFQHLRKAITATTQDEYEVSIMCARSCSRTDDEKHLVQEFVKHADRYCISQSEPKFCGITISSSFAESTNGLIKRVIVDERRCTEVLIKVLRIMQQLQEKSFMVEMTKIDYVQMFDYPEIKVVQNLMCLRLVRAFMERFVKCLPLQYTNPSEDLYIFEDREKLYNVRKAENTEGTYWVCGCKETKKTGLPCIHVMKIIFVTEKDSMVSYIHERWIITPELMDRPEIQRRNLPKKRGRLTKLQKAMHDGKLQLLHVDDGPLQNANRISAVTGVQPPVKHAYQVQQKRGRKTLEDIDV